MKSRHNIKELYNTPTNIGGNVLFSSFTFTGKDPRKGWRTPLNKIIYSEQRDEETGYSYHSARYYDPSLSGIWLSVDPMADKYLGISPYAYCAWSPVKLVDPDGMDLWELTKDGELIWKEASDDDIIKARNGKKVIVNNGVMMRGSSYTKEDNYMCLNFGDDMKNAAEVFEFLADNTNNVEFSFLGFASSIDSEDPSNYIVGTSYTEKGDHYSSKAAENLAKQGLLRQLFHNHPDGNASPSTFYNNGFFYKSGNPGDDVKTADGIDLILSESKCVHKCSFAIYVSQKMGNTNLFIRETIKFTILLSTKKENYTNTNNHP